MGMENLFDRFVKATEPDDPKLYLFSVFYSLFHLAVMWFAYLKQGQAPYAFVIVHMVVVGVLYALPKEIVRWHNGTKPPATKAGHLLVMAWFASFLMMGLGQVASTLDIVSDWAYRLPEGMTEMICFLVATLGITHTSKKKHALKHPPCPGDPPPAADPPQPAGGGSASGGKTENPPT